jgi:glutaminyl-peptide cyclotransferase
MKMRHNYIKYFILLTLILLITWIISCSGKPGSTSGIISQPVSTTTFETDSKLIKIISPKDNAGYKLRDNIKVVIEVKDAADSVKLWFDGQAISVLRNSPWEYTIPSSFTGKTGRKALKAIAYKRGNKPQTMTRIIILYSDVVPVKNSYKIINAYPHDKEAFTQGLVYENGILYEGTGLVGESSLRKVELQTGKVLDQLNLEGQLFGEGIAIMGDKIYQLTWETKTGFVYDKSSFKLINKISYQNQGWGLTAIGDKLIMSDGSNILYFMEPKLFTVTSNIEVYDNKAIVDKLNELEYINGEIWANIWQTNLIARIDPQSGKVLSYIDLKGIDPVVDTNVNVLNGIAYDAAGKRIFVTGKNWPKLFEIKITE